METVDTKLGLYRQHNIGPRKVRAAEVIRDTLQIPSPVNSVWIRSTAIDDEAFKWLAALVPCGTSVYLLTPKAQPVAQTLAIAQRWIEKVRGAFYVRVELGPQVAAWLFADIEANVHSASLVGEVEFHRTTDRVRVGFTASVEFRASGFGLGGSKQESGLLLEAHGSAARDKLRQAFLRLWNGSEFLDRVDEISLLLMNYRLSHAAVDRELIYDLLLWTIDLKLRHYGIPDSERDDIIQQAVIKFTQQEERRAGIFGDSADVSPQHVHAAIGRNLRHRAADAFRQSARRQRMFSRSLDEAPTEGDDGAERNSMESAAAFRRHKDKEFFNRVDAALAPLMRAMTDPLEWDALQSMLDTGRSNTAELARKHNRSQATVWRRVEDLRKRSQQALENDDFGPSRNS